MTDRFDSETVRRYLTSSGVSVTVFDEVDSTNRIALELADGGADTTALDFSKSE